MRIQFGADVLHHFVHGTASDLAFFDFAGSAVNAFVPLRFGVGILLRIEAGDELMGQIRPVGRGEGQHFGNLFSADAPYAGGIDDFRGFDKRGGSWILILLARAAFAGMELAFIQSDGPCL
jgi:hypothetical protein